MRTVISMKKSHSFPVESLEHSNKCDSNLTVRSKGAYKCGKSTFVSELRGTGNPRYLWKIPVRRQVRWWNTNCNKNNINIYMFVIFYTSICNYALKFTDLYFISEAMFSNFCGKYNFIIIRRKYFYSNASTPSEDCRLSNAAKVIDVIWKSLKQNPKKRKTHHENMSI